MLSWSSYLRCMEHSQCILSHIAFCSHNVPNNDHLSIGKLPLRWKYRSFLLMDLDSGKRLWALQQSYFPTCIEFHIEWLEKCQGQENSMYSMENIDSDPSKKGYRKCSKLFDDYPFPWHPYLIYIFCIRSREDPIKSWMDKARCVEWNSKISIIFVRPSSFVNPGTPCIVGWTCKTWI